MTSVETSSEFLPELRNSSDVRRAEAAGRLQILAGEGRTRKWGFPVGFTTLNDQEKAQHARAIVEMVSECCFDLVLVDGRWRIASALHALRLADEGTRIVIHDAHRYRPKLIAAWFHVDEEVSDLKVLRPHSSSIAAARANASNFSAAYQLALLDLMR